MTKLIYRQYLEARFVGHGASVSDRTEGHADPDACIRFHNTQKPHQAWDTLTRRGCSEVTRRNRRNAQYGGGGRRAKPRQILGRHRDTNSIWLQRC